jgi:hypothetical protein
MFPALLLVTLLLALAVSYLVTRAFTRPLESILNRIIGDEISSAWLSKYLKFAIIVVGVSAGVRIHELEKYITPFRYDKEARIVELTRERWVLELYRTVRNPPGDRLDVIGVLCVRLARLRRCPYCRVKASSRRRQVSDLTRNRGLIENGNPDFLIAGVPLLSERRALDRADDL